ncbi:hypothetical protein [Alteromonas gilva]|uniref:Uncharacterized protein n=1 Tax=Alteromonas gilva TaxID=2987522 RepID=A0ABT5KZU4_9ALTE|nr:hypothetical protein [Alteromonas gilva]MDC8830295.1 hypothetical protein [Alteromonas gilva]
MSTHQNDRSKLTSAKHIQIASIFSSKETADDAIDEVVKSTDVGQQQITLVQPGDTEFNRKLEGDSKALGKMMWYSHLILGASGLVVGLIIAYLLVAYGPALTQQNPTATYIAMVSPGIFTGVFVAGLLSLRPDRTQIIDVVRQAVKRSQYAVVVNLRKDQSVSRISELFSRNSNKVVESIQ